MSLAALLPLLSAAAVSVAVPPSGSVDGAVYVPCREPVAVSVWQATGVAPTYTPLPHEIGACKLPGPVKLRYTVAPPGSGLPLPS